MNRTVVFGLVACLGGFGCSSGDAQPAEGSPSSDSGSDVGLDGRDSSTEDTGKPQDATTEDGAKATDKDGDGYKSDVDCNDSEFSVHPGATEVCNGIDDNCDGQIDEEGATGGKSWYADADGDGYGDAKKLKAACNKPAGYVQDSSDCDDKSGEVNPKATEACNGIDDNCDGQIDEVGAIGASPWYPDKDGDGFGDEKGKVSACKKPSGFLSQGGDCDDGNAAINSGKLELCGNNIDDNCDGLTDDPTSSDAIPYYADKDGDLFGAGVSSGKACAAPSGNVLNSLDCDDASKLTYPGAPDAPDANGVDSNCDTIDGDLNNAIFVSPSGLDTNSGLGVLEKGVPSVKPVKTLKKAISLAASDPKRYVLIAQGEYDQGEASLVLQQGVSLYGGYSATWTDRSALRAAVVVKSTGAAPTVSATSITEPVVLDRMTIEGPDLTTSTIAGAESVAMVVSGTGTEHMIRLSDVQIVAGKGAPGRAGTNAANATPTCTCPGGGGAEPLAAGTIGGNGGFGLKGSCGDAAPGGPGAEWYQCACNPFPLTFAQNGTSGSNGQTCGAAVAGGTNSLPNNSSKGTFAGTDWIAPTTGTSGVTGPNGGGGGGGGAGGSWGWCCDYWAWGCHVSHTQMLTGGAGGLGGAGGCGAAGGGAGSAGGASFGIVLVSSTVDFSVVNIELGKGGAGGSGGSGGNGLGGVLGANGGAQSKDSNGWGADCNVAQWFDAYSGKGGSGGNGGAGCGGGGGAGGHGGWSVGLVRVGSFQLFSLPDFTDSTGAGGAAGPSGIGGLSGDGQITSIKGAAGVAGTMIHDQQY